LVDVLVEVSFPASVMGVEETVSILALVCPEPEGPKQVPAIIGTNASFFPTFDWTWHSWS